MRPQSKCQMLHAITTLSTPDTDLMLQSKPVSISLRF